MYKSSLHGMNGACAIPVFSTKLHLKIPRVIESPHFFSDSNQHRPKAMHAVSPLQAYSQLPVCIPSRAGAAVDSSPDGQGPDVYLFYHFNSCLMPPCVLDTERPTARF